MNKYLATYGKPRFLGIIQISDDTRAEIAPDELTVVRSHRGEELAEIVGVLTEGQEKEYRNMRTISEHGEGPVRGGDPVVTDLQFLRVPSDADMSAQWDHTDSEDDILAVAHELITWHKLPIKLVDAEFLLDEKKLFFYFTSDQRVDFRTLVKDLARRFKTRIELRQMGVRDEARIIKGLSSCGLPCCCSYWLNQFSPIGIRMVKEQNIALNPAKISGICGRLMCCMAYEHKVYKELWNGLPGPGSKIKTPAGNYIVLAIDVAKEALRCHKPGGGDILVPIGLFAEFKQAVTAGEEWEAPQREESGAEPEPCGKVSCLVCRNKCERRGQARSLKLQPPGEKQDEKPAVQTDREEQATSQQKRPRRRGRRGGRGGKEAQPALPAHEKRTTGGQPERERDKVPDRGKKKPEIKILRRHHAQPASAPAGGGDVKDRERGGAPKDASDAKAPKRPRRRPRRPKRPGADHSGSTAVAE